MLRRSRVLPITGVLVLLTAAAFRQSALTQLGLTEALARELILEDVGNGGTDSRAMSARSYTRLVVKGRQGYQSYRENKPWMWVEAILAGKEAVTAARAAAEVWLKELGQ